MSESAHQFETYPRGGPNKLILYGWGWSSIYSLSTMKYLNLYIYFILYRLPLILLFLNILVVGVVVCSAVETLGVKWSSVLLVVVLVVVIVVIVVWYRSSRSEKEVYRFRDSIRQFRGQIFAGCRFLCSRSNFMIHK